MDKSFLHINANIRYPGFEGDYQLKLPKGITGFIGPSGHGKSTLLHLIAGFKKPDNGFVSCNGELWCSKNDKVCLPPEKRNIGYIFQSGRLFPHLNVKRNLLFGVKSGSQIPQEFDEIVDALQIRHLLDKKIQVCSGGEKQRIAIGRSLLPKPKILIMDEPFASLDKGLRNSTVKFVRNYCERHGMTVLLTSHDIIDTFVMAENFVLVYEGKITAQGQLTDLLEHSTGVTLLEEAGLHNIVKMNVQKRGQSDGIVLLTNNHEKHPVKIVQEPVPLNVEKKQDITISIKPDSISLALHPISDISMQNQLPGAIIRIIKKENRCYCVVDCGITLLVEITLRSVHELDLFVGKNIYCLFKAISVKVIG